jgi:hypothetical protein
VPTVCIFSLITAGPTAFGVDLISGGNIESPPGGGVLGPAALAVLAMKRLKKTLCVFEKETKIAAGF